MNDTEKHRLMCELRHWISEGYTTPDLLRALQDNIKRKRGKASAELLVKRIRWYLCKS